MTATAYNKALLQLTHAQIRLGGVEQSLKAMAAGEDGEETLLDKFERDSAGRGGEQYLVDRTKISCEPAGGDPRARALSPLSDVHGVLST